MAFLKGKRAAVTLALASALALGGCYDGYGYGGLSAGYGGVYNDGYYGNPGGYYGGGPGYAGYGWYDNFYYPGSGYYVYDRGGSRRRWNDNQRRYWQGRRDQARLEGRGGRRGDGLPGTVRPGDGVWSGRGADGRPPNGNGWRQGRRAGRPDAPPPRAERSWGGRQGAGIPRAGGGRRGDGLPGTVRPGDGVWSGRGGDGRPR